jgi:hypothetical protein
LDGFNKKARKKCWWMKRKEEIDPHYRMNRYSLLLLVGWLMFVIKDRPRLDRSKRQRTFNSFGEEKRDTHTQILILGVNWK